MYIRMQKNPAITCTVQYSMLRGPCFQFVKLLIKLLFLVLLLQSTYVKSIPLNKIAVPKGTVSQDF